MTFLEINNPQTEPGPHAKLFLAIHVKDAKTGELKFGTGPRTVEF